MLSHGVVGFALGLLTAGLMSDLLDGIYSFIYLSAGGVLLLVGLILLIRELASRNEGPTRPGP